jgi:hypothetical protein
MLGPGDPITRSALASNSRLVTPHLDTPRFDTNERPRAL